MTSEQESFERYPSLESWKDNSPSGAQTEALNLLGMGLIVSNRNVQSQALVESRQSSDHGNRHEDNEVTESARARILALADSYRGQPQQYRIRRPDMFESAQQEVDEVGFSLRNPDLFESPQKQREAIQKSLESIKRALGNMREKHIEQDSQLLKFQILERENLPRED